MVSLQKVAIPPFLNIAGLSPNDYLQHILKACSTRIFISKLWIIIMTEDCIEWEPDFISFKIIDTTKLANEVIPKYFKHNSLTSFLRQLNYYQIKCFKDRKIYRNENFQRDLLLTVHNISRTTFNNVKNVKRVDYSTKRKHSDFTQKPSDSDPKPSDSDPKPSDSDPKPSDIDQKSSDVETKSSDVETKSHLHQPKKYNTRSKNPNKKVKTQHKHSVDKPISKTTLNYTYDSYNKYYQYLKLKKMAEYRPNCSNIKPFKQLSNFTEIQNELSEFDRLIDELSVNYYSNDEKMYE